MNNLEKEFVPYQESLELKELGFDEPCLAYYIELRNPSEGILTIDKCENNIDGVLTPTFSQPFRWFREKYNLFGCIDLQVCTPTHWYIRIDNIIENDYIYHSEDEGLKFNTYEEAELACLRKLIEIVKDKKL